MLYANNQDNQDTTKNYHCYPIYWWDEGYSMPTALVFNNGQAHGILRNILQFLFL